MVVTRKQLATEIYSAFEFRSNEWSKKKVILLCITCLCFWTRALAWYLNTATQPAARAAVKTELS